MIIAGPCPQTHRSALSFLKDVVSLDPASPPNSLMTSLKRRRESPSPSTEPSPLLPSATNSNRSASVSAPVPRRASAPANRQITTDPIFASPYIYSPVYPTPAQTFKRQRVMVPSSPYPTSSAHEYVYSTASYDPTGISSLPTPTPTISGPTGSYTSAYPASVGGMRSPSVGYDSSLQQPMSSASGMSGYPTPSTTYAATSSNYQMQSPVSPYGPTAYYNNLQSMGMTFDNPPSEQQIAKAKRQQQNRDAQKRFREKKKATQQDMEQRLGDVERQLEECHNENIQLQAENDHMRRLLAMQNQMGQAVMGSGNSGRPQGKQPRGPSAGRLSSQSP